MFCFSLSLSHAESGRKARRQLRYEARKRGYDTQLCNNFAQRCRRIAIADPRFRVNWLRVRHVQLAFVELPTAKKKVGPLPIPASTFAVTHSFQHFTRARPWCGFGMGLVEGVEQAGYLPSSPCCVVCPLDGARGGGV